VKYHSRRDHDGVRPWARDWKWLRSRHPLPIPAGDHRLSLCAQAELLCLPLALAFDFLRYKGQHRRNGHQSGQSGKQYPAPATRQHVCEVADNRGDHRARRRHRGSHIRALVPLTMLIRHVSAPAPSGHQEVLIGKYIKLGAGAE